MNHQSFIDLCLVPHILPTETRYLAKKELSQVPLWGAVVGRAGTYPISIEKIATEPF